MSDMEFATAYDWIVCPECGSEEVDAYFESRLGEPPHYHFQCEECGNHNTGSTHYGLS